MSLVLNPPDCHELTSVRLLLVFCIFANIPVGRTSFNTLRQPLFKGRFLAEPRSELRGRPTAFLGLLKTASF